MTIRPFILISFVACFVILVIAQCNTSSSVKRATETTAQNITPVNLPIVTPGFHFPEDSNTIYKWINNTYDSTSVYTHAWGIWAGLTAQSGQVFEDDSILVYQTWLGIGEVQDLVRNGVKKELDTIKKTNRTILRIPNQLLHTGLVNPAKVHVQNVGGFHLNLLDVRTKTANAAKQLVPDSAPSFVAVSYNPASVKHVVSNSLLDSSVIASYKNKNGIGAIPAFPNNAINIKPTYYIGHAADKLIQIPVWQGIPAAMVFPDENITANSYVFVDMQNKQTPGKKLQPVKGGQAPTIAATCNLSDFIYFKIDSAMASYINQQQGAGSVQKNDVALLVAMHVTSKEISNWTWQSYYWDPNPDAPNAPSSKLAASLKQGLGIKGVAAHYSLTTAYNMVLPNQPITGGTNTGATAMIGFNPYLEGAFNPSTFNLPSKLNASFKYGVQTNCMSCHALATADGGLGYTTDQYIDMRDKMFINKVQVDFAWSIQGSIINK